ncbi:MAG: biotin/lipoyl-binding protein [Holophagaceae bacterium]|nr:biotin/lipoyl-binding protein [Holophagaceae bacterium]
MKRTLLIGKETHDVEILRQDGVTTLVWDGTAQAVDILEMEPGSWSVIMDGRSVDVRLDAMKQADPDVQGFRATLFDAPYEFALQDPRKALLAAAGGAASSGGTLTAPMPGKVVKLLVKEGDTVIEAQPLLIMEAMKMQNELRATSAGRVSKITVQEGATVETGGTLMILVAPEGN